MLRRISIIAFGLCFLLMIAVPDQEKNNPSYEKDVSPIIGKYCLPCHLSDNENPSGLALDDFGMLIEGGEHGDIVEAGKPEESLLYQKLQDDPPFGKRMPRNKKKLSAEEIRTIYVWIQKGAKEK